ncbi:P-loop containing nucleoside triphosphate hydrolase protein [Cyathus striatus]|nr:P-loop containing nucleoside triphosphate hydrolase protein [Cyathus striatus]
MQWPWSSKKPKVELNKNDTVLKDAKSTDVIIAVMGSSGVGKSSFINTMFNDNRAQANATLTGNTHGLMPIVRMLPSDPTKRLVIIDTPGFDNPAVTISDILNKLSAWLAASYPKNKDMKLAGVLYLHEISQPVPNGPGGTVADSHLKTIHELCGENSGALPVVLGVTSWQQKVTTGNASLNKIKETCWKLLIDQGCRVVEFRSTETSVSAVVNYILKN